MPRLPYPLILAAARRHRCLPLLLQECRDLDSARNELRWLQEHVESTVPDRSFREHVLQRFCLERSRGKPLQYILGSQPFGELEILCKPGVLIPRYSLCRDDWTSVTNVDF
jgi:methylase of polypeptide subunit release factors